MYSTSPSRLTATLALALAACLPFVVTAADWWQAEPPLPAAAPASLLDGSAGWDLTKRRGNAEPAVQSPAGDRPFLTDSIGGFNLKRQVDLADGYEISLDFRVAPPERGRAILSIDAGVQPDATRDSENLRASISYMQGQDYISTTAYNSVPDINGRNFRLYHFRADGNGERRLNWDDAFRRRIEHQAARARSLEADWHRLRLVITPSQYRVYLDGLMLQQCDHALPITGATSVQVWPHVQVAALDIRPLASSDPIYEPVSLDLQVNSATINGAPLTPDSLPPSDRSVQVNGVPFHFPAPDADGNTHLDIGESWFQEGNLQGNMSGRGTGVGGRWRGALYHTPSRLQVRVPRRRYRTLHLIAAADHDPDSVPTITAQFYRPAAGLPQEVRAEVPLFSAAAASVTALPVALTNGDAGRLYHIAIPINPGDLASFDDLDFLEIELTKQTEVYRAYPDPMYYSIHGAGLPSAVHVFAATLEAPRVDMTVSPAAYGHVWTAPAVPSYSLTLHSRADQPRPVTVSLTATSYDGSDTLSRELSTTVPAGGDVELSVELPVTLFGLYDVHAVLSDGDQSWDEFFRLARLRPDDRERGDWAPGKGPFFGYWAWKGGHTTPAAEKEALIMAQAGADGRLGTYQDAKEPEKAVARQYKMVTLKHFGSRDHWITSKLATDLRTKTEEEATATFLEELAKIETEASDITQRRYISFFAEPNLGLVSTGSLNDYAGFPAPEYDDYAKQKAAEYARALHVGVPLLRERWPDAKVMMPHGDPMFFAFMLRYDPSLRDLVDGIAADIPTFERLPENQVHQVTLSRLWQVRQEIEKLDYDKPFLTPIYEGSTIPDLPGAVPADEAPDLIIRNAIILFSFGIDQLTGFYAAFHTANYWGEQHYGSGLMERIPLEYPKAQYVAYATLSRHLNRRAFDRYLPTGSLSTYLTQHRHYADGSLAHVAWTIRGSRTVSIPVPDGATVTLYDMMDNATPLPVVDGRVTFTVTDSPVFLRGLPADPSVALGPADHSDAAPAPIATRLANLGDGSWAVTTETDPTYAENTPIHVIRTHAPMVGTPADAPEAAGGRALAVSFDPAVGPENTFMPYYSVIKPDAPIALPGKGDKLGLWVRGASDWGRVVYALRDAKGERWISVGAKDQWNCDDTPSDSFFCFDGWRYLTFELPSHAPWDSFREPGTTWWGGHDGDEIVDLPLSLESIIVERRTHAMYVNEPQPADPSDVLLGDLYIEYASPHDATADAVRENRLRMPVPTGTPELDNPIAVMQKYHELPAIPITAITLPEHQADGTRCHVHFEPLPDDAGVERYDVYGSPYPDGRGAIKLTRRGIAPGGAIARLRPDTDLYLFLTYSTRVDNKLTESKPSPAFKIRLQDMFVFK